MTSIDRRRLLQVGAVTAISATIAGCLGDENGDDDDGKAETTGAVEIEEFRFVTEQPTGYREYTEVTDATYEEGDIVWIYYDLTGLATESAGEGEATINVTVSLDVTGPTGEQVEQSEEELSQDVREDAVDEQFFYWSFQPPTPTEPGEYTADIEVVDEVGGTEASETGTFTLEADVDYLERFRSLLEDELTISIETVAERDGKAELVYATEHPIDSEAAEFDVGFIAGTYASQVGEGWDTDGLVALVTDGNGYQYRYEVDATKARDFHEERIDENEFILPILDSIVPADFERFFERLLDQETDIQLHELVVDAGTVSIEYESQHAFGEQAATDEIGNVGVMYAIAVREGWQVDELDATFDDVNGDQFTFGVDSETAIDWVTGELTDDEFGSTVRDSVEPAD